MDMTLLVGLGGVAVVTGLVQVVKALTALSDDPWCRVAPLVALALGIGWNWLIGSMLTPPMITQAIIIQGILTGLSAAGLYSGGKTVLGK